MREGARAECGDFRGNGCGRSVAANVMIIRLIRNDVLSFIAIHMIDTAP